MTVVVGVKCTDGIVIGADSAATSADASARPVMMVSTEKVQTISGKVIIAGTGSVGLGQRFGAMARALIQRPNGQPATCSDFTEELCKQVFDRFSKSGAHIGTNRFNYGALAALPYGDNGELVEFEYGNLQPELKTGKLFFASMGSGQTLADPFIAFVNEVLWRDEPPDVRWGSLGVYWALSHTINFAHEGVGKPIWLATLKKDGPAWDVTCSNDNQEHEQHLAAILQKIGEYPTSLIEGAEAEVPPAPEGKS